MGKIIRNGIAFGGGSSDWTGESANVNTAIDNGEITEGMTVNITDDSADSTLFDDIKEYIDTKSSNVLHSLEEVNASTSDKDVVGAAAVKELNKSLELKVDNVYVGSDGKLHLVKGGADSALPFSSKLTATFIGSGNTTQATTFNVSSYNGYESFNIDNFKIVCTGVSVIGDGYSTISQADTYSNGILTVGQKTGGRITSNGSSQKGFFYYDVYLIK